MHRDKRLGLAMGLLIVAIVGAFFFRLQPTSHDQLPVITRQENIDDMIAQMPTGPYLAGVVEDNSPIQQGNTRHRFSQNLPQWNTPELMNEQQQLATSNKETGASLTPDPAPQKQTGTTFSVSHKRIVKPAKKNQNESSSDSIEESAFELPPIDVSLEKDDSPKQNRMFAAENKPQLKPQLKPSHMEPSQTEPSHTTYKARPYRVKAGDTLFKLAEKYLGDKNRYQEIYRINKTKLRSPDDLRVGMLIRMPFVPRMALHKKTGVTPDSTDVFAETPKPQKKNYHLTIETNEERKTPTLEKKQKQAPANNNKAGKVSNTPLRQWPFTKQQP